ncbi:uncharacterized protein Triagg1_4636 [Trichoderma aggressivum f. europaeum]|uniref:Uncharacterized protein n=1 Tax=Trichoderma aggressivum f. europaeum TaxID=173218 RepID=A0AAE1M5J0_9HYPO|nr:hypothetical protein Triagg1_4636 [Trichoderma aggressivum f. europaeum]
MPLPQLDDGLSVSRLPQLVVSSPFVDAFLSSLLSLNRGFAFAQTRPQSVRLLDDRQGTRTWRSFPTATHQLQSKYLAELEQKPKCKHDVSRRGAWLASRLAVAEIIGAAAPAGDSAQG